MNLLYIFNFENALIKQDIPALRDGRLVQASVIDEVVVRLPVAELQFFHIGDFETDGRSLHGFFTAVIL